MLKQIQTTNICLNIESDCISLILWTKVGLIPLEKIPGSAPVYVISFNILITFHWVSYRQNPRRMFKHNIQIGWWFPNNVSHLLANLDRSKGAAVSQVCLKFPTTFRVTRKSLTCHEWTKLAGGLATFQKIHYPFSIDRE